MTRTINSDGDEKLWDNILHNPNPLDIDFPGNIDRPSHFEHFLILYILRQDCSIEVIDRYI